MARRFVYVEGRGVVDPRELGAPRAEPEPSEQQWVPRRLLMQRYWRSRGYRYAPTLHAQREREERQP